MLFDQVGWGELVAGGPGAFAKRLDAHLALRVPGFWPAERGAAYARRGYAGRPFWTRATFANLAGVIGAMSFTGVVSDAVYLIPGSAPAFSLTPEDLKHPQFHYLRQLG